MLGSIGLPELILVFVVVLLLFGPDKLPHFAKTLGKTVREFRSTVEDAKSAIHDEIEKSTGGTADLREVEHDLRQALVSPWDPVDPPDRPRPAIEPVAEGPAHDQPILTSEPVAEAPAPGTTIPAAPPAGESGE